MSPTRDLPRLSTQVRIPLTLATALTVGLAMIPLAPPATASLTCSTGSTFMISSPADLASLASVRACRSPGLTFILADDIILPIAPWTPIGTNDSPFQGIFDGNGKSITGLTLEPATTADPTGLFGYTAGAEIHNLSVTATTTPGRTGWYLGALIGRANNTTVSRVTANATINVGGDGIANGLYVGGLIGIAEGSTISNSTVSSGSSVTSGAFVGGLVGDMIGGSIASSTSGASVVGTSTVGAVGGLVGALEVNAAISSSSASGSVTSLTGDGVGGGVGLLFNGSLTDVQATGTVTGGFSVGGLIGYAGGAHTISHSSATGNVISDGNWTGGFIGRIQAPSPSSEIRDSVSSGSVVSTGNSVGGFIGEAAGGPGFTTVISRSSTSGSVSATWSLFVGGFAGYLYNATVSESFATGSVLGGTNVGGFVGMATEIDVDLQRVYATGSTSSSGGSYTGGLVGRDGDPSSVLTVTDSIWNPGTTGMSGPLGTATSAMTSLAGASSLTSTQMRFSTNFPTSWNFTTVWGYQCSTSVFPQLRGVNASATATSCPEVTPDSGGGVSPSPEPSPTPSPTVVVTTPASQSPAVTPIPAPQAPGSSRMTIGGRNTPVNTIRVARGQGLVVNAGGIELGLRGVTQNQRGAPLSPSGALVLPRSGTLPSEASGLAPGSPLLQTLYSQPVTLGQTAANAEGTARSSAVIPSTTPIGNHTLRITGVTSNREPFVLDMGVIVATPAAALGADPVLHVRARDGVITVIARAVQPGCMVVFSHAGDKVNVSASREGIARATLARDPSRGRVGAVTAQVSGKGCGPVVVSAPIR